MQLNTHGHPCGYRTQGINLKNGCRPEILRTVWSLCRRGCQMKFLFGALSKHDHFKILWSFFLTFIDLSLAVKDVKRGWRLISPWREWRGDTPNSKAPTWWTLSSTSTASSATKASTGKRNCVPTAVDATNRLTFCPRKWRISIWGLRKRWNWRRRKLRIRRKWRKEKLRIPRRKGFIFNHKHHSGGYNESIWTFFTFCTSLSTFRCTLYDFEVENQKSGVKDLIWHKTLVHVNQKYGRYKCDVCEERFVLKEQLDLHQTLDVNFLPTNFLPLVPCYQRMWLHFEIILESKNHPMIW